MRKRINTKVIAVRLPQDEAERIKEAADAAEMSVSMWLRQAAVLRMATPLFLPPAPSSMQRLGAEFEAIWDAPHLRCTKGKTMTDKMEERRANDNAIDKPDGNG